jgi:3-oxoacyl-[acyl-carrier-protein] synthase-1
LRRRKDLVPGQSLLVGEVTRDLPDIPPELSRYTCRTNMLSLAAFRQIEGAVTEAVARVGARRAGVVMGSSTSGIASAEAAVATWLERGELPPSFDYACLEFGGVASFLAAYAGITGPAFTLSTACSSGARALESARSLLDLGVCDVVLAGGADSLCALTAAGFVSLQAVSDDPSNPFSLHRSGLTLGEGAAVFLLTREPGPIVLLGTGSSGEGYHMSAPEPDGTGAEAAMRAALLDAQIEPRAVTYVNLHGTGTPLNDAMEARAVHRVLGDLVPCSSSKPLVGHTLGASGAIEAGICWLMLDRRAHEGQLRMPPHPWDGVPDPTIPRLHLVDSGNPIMPSSPVVLLSNSFGFGGNNCTVILGER